MRGVRKNRYREATRTLQSKVPDNLRGCWSRLYPKASRSKYQSIKSICIRCARASAVLLKSVSQTTGQAANSHVEDPAKE